jgi:transcriptional regulator with XRE-family HTH domain
MQNEPRKADPMIIDSGKLSRLMSERGVTQIKMANEIKESDDSISRIIKGETKNPRIYLIYKIAKFLRVPVQDLLVDSLDLPND